MTRHGSSRLPEVIVVAAILFLLAALVVYGFSAGMMDASNIFGDQRTIADRDTCESRVMEFCARDGSEGEDWTERYPECEDYVGEIADTEICGDEVAEEDGATGGPEDPDPAETDPDDVDTGEEDDPSVEEDHEDAEDTRGSFIAIRYNHNMGSDNIHYHRMADELGDTEVTLNPDFLTGDNVCSLALVERNWTPGISNDYGVYTFDYGQNTEPVILDETFATARNYDHSETDHTRLSRQSTTDIWEKIASEGLYGQGHTMPSGSPLIREYYFDLDGDDFEFDYRMEGEVICGEYDGETQWVQCREFRDGATVTIPGSGETFTCNADLDLEVEGLDISAPPAGEWGTWD